MLFYVLSGVGCAWAGTATQFVFTQFPGPGNYEVNQTKQYTVEARDASNQRDNAFNGTVTIGLYDSTTVGSPSPSISDPSAEIVAGGVTFIGTAVVTFTNGVLSFTATFKTGFDHEALLIQHATLPYQADGVYSVIGYKKTYYPMDSNGDSTGVLPPGDPLVSEAASVIGPPLWVDLPQTSGPIGSLAYVISGLDGGYSSGDAVIIPNLRVMRTVPTGNSQVRYRIILDYDGDLVDYDVPDPIEDTVYQPTDVSNPGSSPTTLGPGELYSGNVTIYAPQMTNGKVILRIWRQGIAPAALQVRGADNSQLSWIEIPYSDANVMPIRASLSPKTHLVSSATNLYYVLENKSDRALAFSRFAIPANPGGTGTPWTLSATPTTRAGASVTYSNPSGTTDGDVYVDWHTNPLLVNESATVTMSIDVSSAPVTGWAFSLTQTDDSGGVSIMRESGNAEDLVTLGAPSSPAGFTAFPLYYQSAGGALTFSWGQVTDQDCQGYILSRRTPAGSGSFGDAVTLTPNTTLAYSASVSNQVSYEYRLTAFNSVVESAPVTGAPVTAFVNPGPPTGLQSYTRNNAVMITWSAPASVDGSFPVGNYVIFRGTASNPTSAIATVGAASTSYNDTGAANAGVTYHYRLQTRDNAYTGTPADAHLSGYSSQVEGYPPGNPPTNLGGVFDGATTVITLTWNTPVGNSYAPATYQVYRGEDAPPVMGAPLTAVSAPVTSIDDPGTVALGRYYTYVVESVDSSGVTSNLSAVATVYTIPSAPVSFTATASSSAVTLDWDPVLSQGVSYYLIDRNGSQAASLNGAAVSTWTDTTALQEVDYQYVIAAWNAGGRGDPATVQSALLPAAPLSPMTPASGPDQAVSLTWASAPATNVNAYNIYRNTSNGFSGSTTLIEGLWGAVTFLDTTGLSPGSVYYYFLTYSNPGGNGPPSGACSVRVAPNVPTGLAANPSAAAVTLTWTDNPPSENVTEYRVYRNTSSPATSGTMIGTSAVSPYVDTTASASVSYYYAVVAYCGDPPVGGESHPSAEIVSGRTAQMAGNLATDMNGASKTDVLVTWDAVDASSTSVTLFYNTVNDSGTATQVPLSTSAVSYIDAGKSPGTWYFYWLMSVNPYGDSPLAGPLSILLPPSPPTLNAPTLDPGNETSVVLSWPSSAEVINGYNVYRALPPATWGPTPVATAGPSATAVTVASQPRGQVVNYRLTAQNGRDSDPSNSVTIVIPPSVPGGQVAQSGFSTTTSYVTIGWVPNAGSESVTAFTLNRAEAQAGPYTVVAPPILYPTPYVAGTTVYFPDTTTVDGTVYYYVISAEANATTCLWSSSNAVPVTAYRQPNAPAGVAIDTGNASVTLTWTAAVSTTYPIANYRIYRGTSPGVPGTTASATVAGTTFTHTSLTNGTRYYYVIRAVDNQGHLSPLSTEVNDIPAMRPGAPVSLRADKGDGQITLDWNPSPPGTFPVSQYVVYQGPASIGPWTAAATLSASHDWYVDSGLADGTVRYYEIQAIDSSGSSSAAHISVVSAISSADTSTAYVNPPTGLEGIATGTKSIRLTWIPPNPGVPPKALDTIRIYRFSSAGVTTGAWIATVPNTPSPVTIYNDPDLEEGTTYYYKVQTVSNMGVTSAFSNEVEVATDALTRPTPPLEDGQMALDHNKVRAVSGATLGIFFMLNSPENKVEIRIYNVMGDLMGEIHYGPAPAHVMQVADWALKDRLGATVSTGIYLVEFTAGTLHIIKKVAVVK